MCKLFFLGSISCFRLYVLPAPGGGRVFDLMAVSVSIGFGLDFNFSSIFAYALEERVFRWW